MGERNKLFEVEGVTYKKCNGCGEVLSINNYSKAKYKKSGIRGECKFCQKKARLKSFKEESDPNAPPTIIVNFSGGKDSTAMLLHMIELGEHIDYIVFADAGYEFPMLYDYIKTIEKLIKRPITILKANKSLDDWRFGKFTRGNKVGKIRGMPSVVAPCYWMRESKYLPLKKFSNSFPNSINCIGIASDEQERVQINPNIRYPLIEWGWSEEKCIDYLQDKGILNDMYKHFSRTGCWMCPKQSNYSKYMLYKHYPKLWSMLKIIDRENYRDTGKYLFIKSTNYYEELFNSGKVPKDNGSICYECKGIRNVYTEGK